MQRLAMDCLRPAMISAADVVDHGGRLLIRAGGRLQEFHIKTMRKLGFESAYVNLTGLPAASPMEDLVSPELRLEAIRLIGRVYNDFRTKDDIDGAPIIDLADRLVNEIILRRLNLFHCVDLRTPENYLPSHVFNVAVLSVLIGLKMDYAPVKLNELALGALMMDIGEMLVPTEILRKTDKLTPDEMAEVKRHPEAGFDGLRKKLHGGLPATSVHVAYQHHESFDGNGYPRGLGGADIHEYARIASAADMFDALLSDRPFRHYYLPHEAAAILNALSGRFLDSNIVQHLISHVALYPQGSLVQVDSGEVGEVETVNHANPSRPRIRLLMDPWGKRIKELAGMDLARTQSRMIVKVFKDQEITDLILS